MTKDYSDQLPKNRIFSGVQPTGNLHLGNYLGAIRNWVNMQADYECIFCVVDMHALTVNPDPNDLRNSIREVAASFMAAGIDVKKSALFNQSRNPNHAELAWVFNCVARMVWLNRMT
ncbi:MAG: tryptophan--tRNA ligase, partial [Alphaproteobacteria bacterium]|nr:tryptophan--tRNA ligase [Alphaproteobacteria bacterium]